MKSKKKNKKIIIMGYRFLQNQGHLISVIKKSKEEHKN